MATTGSGQYGSMLLHSKDDKEFTSNKLWGSCRLVFTLCAFLCTLNLILMRFNLSFAMVCMTYTKPISIPNSTYLGLLNDTDRNLQNLSTGSAKFLPPEECLSTKPSEDAAPGFDQLGEFEWNKELQGRILSGFFYGYTISQGFGGWFSDKFGGKLLFVVGNLLQSILTLFMPLAARYHPEALFVLRILQGLVTGFGLPAMFNLFSKWAAPSERTRLMSIAYTGFPLANVLIFPLASTLCQIEVDGGWPMIFYVTGTFGTIVALSYVILVYDNPNTHPRISYEEKRYLNKFSTNHGSKDEPLTVPWKAILTSRAFLAYNVAHFCQTWGFVTLAVNLPTMMKEMLYFDISSNGWLSSLPYVAALFMRIFIAEFFWHLQKWTGLSLTKLRKVNHLIGTIIPAIAVLSITALHCKDKYAAVALIVICSMFGDLGFTGSYLLSYLDLAPQYAGLLTGMSNMIGSIPGIVSSTITGYITSNSTKEEWTTVLYIMAALYFFGGIFYAFFGSSELQTWAKREKKDKIKGDTLL